MTIETGRKGTGEAPPGALEGYETEETVYVGISAESPNGFPVPASMAEPRPYRSHAIDALKDKGDK